MTVGRKVARWTAPVIVCNLLLSACAASLSEGVSTEGAEDDPTWMAAITPEDRERLERLPEAWSIALEQARAAGYADDVAALGALADPDAALSDPAPPAGRYRCRTIKMGAQGSTLAFVAYGWFECEIPFSEGGLRLVKRTGSQRQSGALYSDSEERLVFLGSLALGSSESAAPPYGDDRERNVVGLLERIGPDRWRLVQPWPRYESVLDMLELVPM